MRFEFKLVLAESVSGRRAGQAVISESSASETDREAREGLSPPSLCAPEAVTVRYPSLGFKSGRD